MNEIKRQLNQKMGDTTSRSNSIIQKVEAATKAQRKRQNPKHSFSKGPIFAALATCITAIALFILLSPWQTQTPSKNSAPSNPVENPITAPDDTETPSDGSQEVNGLLKSYFKENGTTAYFTGSGNEYVEKIIETTTWLSEQYVSQLIVNGGSTTHLIYRITASEVQLVFSENADEGVTQTSIAQLDQMPVLDILMEAPFEDGHTFGNRTIYTNIELITPFKTFTTIRIDEQLDGMRAERYYAPGFGLVGEKYTFEDGNLIESYLTSLNEEPLVEDLSNKTIEIYNATSQTKETHFITNLSFIDPSIYMANEAYYANMTYERFTTYGQYEYGVIAHDCQQNEICQLLFVKKAAEEYTDLVYVSGQYGIVSLSDSKEFLVIPVHQFETDGTSTIERSIMIVINLETGKSVIPNEQSIYFDSFEVPIISHRWENNDLLLTIADVNSYTFNEIKAWQNSSDKRTKEVRIKITK